ncbi:RRQRL motif-containing zinc-binding protein [Streptosporangium amethystogenes subsp. fukuiense]|uniref:RRQRL motif-containing zinc-binding protein n=1 Tax=Streptosporangium amethystogenes subsp. fukuiense TaxID=698418 RepID=A0ABW2TGR0_9ACTN
MGRILGRFYDPTGARYTVPTWPWGMSPAHLMTRRQLANQGLRPGRQGVQGQVMWRSRRAGSRDGVRVAYLYDVGQALPKRQPTARQLAALALAMAARRTCPECGTDRGYVIPTSLGMCVSCELGESGVAA